MGSNTNVNQNTPFKSRNLWWDYKISNSGRNDGVRTILNIVSSSNFSKELGKYLKRLIKM